MNLTLEDMIAEAVADDLEHKNMMTRWLIVVEVIDKESGELALHTLRDKNTPYWTARGMIDNVQLDEELTDSELDDD